MNKGVRKDRIEENERTLPHLKKERCVIISGLLLRMEGSSIEGRFFIIPSFAPFFLQVFERFNPYPTHSTLLVE